MFPETGGTFTKPEEPHSGEKSELIHKWSDLALPVERCAVPDGTHFRVGSLSRHFRAGLSHSAAMRLERAGSCIIAWSRMLTACSSTPRCMVCLFACSRVI